MIGSYLSRVQVLRYHFGAFVLFGCVPNCRVRYENRSARTIALYPITGIWGILYHWHPSG